MQFIFMNISKLITHLKLNWFTAKSLREQVLFFIIWFLALQPKIISSTMGPCQSGRWVNLTVHKSTWLALHVVQVVLEPAVLTDQLINTSSLQLVPFNQKRSLYMYVGVNKGPEVIRLFPNSTQPSKKFVPLINIRMPTI